MCAPTLAAEHPTSTPFELSPIEQPEQRLARLDYLAFPHIVDAVLSFSDREALLAVRGASRAFREAADARLSQHLVCGWAAVETSSGRHPALRQSHAFVCATPATDPVHIDVVSSTPWWPSSSPPAVPSSPSSPSLMLVPKPRVIDFDDMFTPRTLSLLPTHVPVLRFWLSTFMHNPAVATSSDTLVLFGWPRSATTWTVYEPWVVLRTHKVVYHINTRFRAHSELLAQLRSASPSGGVSELVVIVSPSRPPPRQGETAPFLHFLRCVVAAARRRPDIKVTVVNGKAIPNIFPSDGSVVFGDDGVAPSVSCFREYVAAMLDQGHGQGEGGKKALKHWSFVSVDEYRERVGERQFELEMGL